MAEQRSLIRIAGLQMESLLRSDAEGTILLGIQRLAEQAADLMAGITNEIVKGGLVGDELVRKTMYLQYLRGRMEAFREALEIPQDIVRAAEATKSLDMMASTSA